MAHSTTNVAGTPKVPRPGEPLSARLERLRQTRNLTYQRLTLELNRELRALGRPPVSKTTVGRWFQGMGQPRLLEGAILAGLLGIRLPDLVEETCAAPRARASRGAVGRITPWQAQALDVVRVLGRTETFRRLLAHEPNGKGRSRAQLATAPD